MKTSILFAITERFQISGCLTGISAISARMMLILSVLQPALAKSQTTESLTVPAVAPDIQAWLVEAVQANEVSEDRNATTVESEPYAQAAAGRAAYKSTVPIYSQPAGALSGKVVYAMAGHGWTYDADKMYYYTQRGLSHGMVEDMGNADQMHIFAHLLFNAGATVVPLKPVDYQPNERILDNQMPQVKFFGEWRKGSSDKFFGSPDDEIPYAFAEAGLEETAVARYRPYIPESGYYPVYAWARDGDDRSNQLYRVAYAGGLSEVRVNWRRVGKTWVWLGTYYFEKGTDGYVETSNQVIDPYEVYQKHVVVADAIRFGNGRGDVPRPGGISGFSREDEGDSYWIERSLGVNADRRLFDVGRDGSSTISSPPKAAAYTNRETEGSFLDRVLVSFHSNASSGKARGAVALFNASADRRPSYQESFAEILGHEVNRQMSAEKPPADEQWVARERNTYSGINFGELRRDYINNEMVATIVETAFHDNADDVEFLLDPTARIQMAQATLRGLLRWYAEVAQPNSSYMLPPSRPPAISAMVNGGRIVVKWQTGQAGEFDGGPPTSIKVYRSTNGYGFDGGIMARPEAESVIVDPLTTDSATFLRVTALNSAGESIPSQTIAVYIGSSVGRNSEKNVASLLVAPAAALDRSENVPYRLDLQPGGPYQSGAETQRVRAMYALLEPAGRAEAEAMAALGEPFNGANSAALEAGMIKLEDQNRVFFAAETYETGTPLLSEKLQQSLRAFLENDGKLYVAGTGVATNIASQGEGQANFLRDVLGVTDTATVVPGSSLASTNPRFLPTTTTITLSKSVSFWDIAPVQPVAYEPIEGRTISLMQYVDSSEKAAAFLGRPTTSEGEIFLFGFPLSLVNSTDQRVMLMKAVLKQM